MTFLAKELSTDSGSPVELYEFVYQNVYLRYTTAADPQVYNGNTFTPYALKRGNIAAEAVTYDQALELTAFQDFPPAQLFRVQAPSAVLHLTIRRKHNFDTDNEFAVLWIGKVLNVSWGDGSQVTLTCQSDLASMKQLTLRRPYQLGCPHPLYGIGCYVNPVNYAITVTSFAANGRIVTAQGLASYPVNYFAGGYLKYPNALNGITEVFAIRQSAAGVLTLALTPTGIETAATMTAFPGCDHTTSTCANTFDNLDNFGGQPYIPGTNPFAGTQLF